MCNPKCDEKRMTDDIDFCFAQSKERWVLIENKSGNLETIPEISYNSLKKSRQLKGIKLIYQLKK